MDERLRDLERRAKGGDLDAATRWFMELNRADSKNYEVILEAMKLVGELQYPGMAETLRELEELGKLTGPPYVDGPGVWSTGFIMRDDAFPTGFIFDENTGP